MSFIILFLFIFCLTLETTTVTVTANIIISSSSVSSSEGYPSKCNSKPIYYASECLAMENCGWCCERPIGSQCFDISMSHNNNNKEGSLFPTCSDHALLHNSNLTCGDLCSGPVGDCKSCEKKNWCYFCITSSACQAPYDSCFNGQVIQSCDMLEKQAEDNLYYFKILIYVGGALIGSAFLGSIILITIRVRQRMREEHWNLTEEGRPFLSGATQAEGEETNNNNNNNNNDNNIDRNTNTTTSNNNNNNNNNNSHNVSNSSQIIRVDRSSNEAQGEDETLIAQAPISTSPSLIPTIEPRENLEVRLTPRSAKTTTVGDEDSLCFLCLDSNPSVTFLPCYHTCCCEDCSNKLRPTRGEGLTCPFCRTKIAAMVSLHCVLLRASAQSS